MNERFKTLWFEAAESKNGNSWEEQTEFMKKFAELIVGECVNMIEAAAENADDEDVHGMRNAAGLISRAFITFYDAELKNERTF